MHRAALLIGLALTPAVAFDAGDMGARTESASVVADANAYVGVTKYAVVLEPANGHEADIVRAVHNYVGDADVAVEVTASLVNGPPARFALVSPTTVTLNSQNDANTFRIKDTDALHAPTNVTVTVRISARVLDTGSRTGRFELDRATTVEVKLV